MSASQTCPVCGSPLPSDAPRGFCPKCLLAPRPPQPAAEATVRLPSPAGAPAPPAHEPSQSEIVIPNSKIDRLRYFGDYELIEEIARGGMGVVYKARQVSLNRTVAVKMILSGQLAGPAEVQRFRHEAEAAANLQHPNIVTIHEIGEHEGHQYFSMDYVEGKDLANLVCEGPLPAKRAATYLKTIAEAIHYAHGRGVLHRDLKPSNVLIDANDQPRVTDFGLAKRFGVPPSGGSPTDAPDRAATPSVTLTGQVVGTPAYMAPEQASGKSKEVGPSCDVYSLGAILYELVAGRPPFVAETPMEILMQVVSAEPVSPRMLNPSVPRDLETICLKCLEKEPARRYASAQELADELARFLRDEPIQARPASRAEKMWRWCRRKPVLSGLATSTALLLLAVFIGSPIAAFRINRERLRAEQNAKQEERQRERAESAVTRLEIERAESLFASDGSSRALAYLGRLLRQQPTNRIVAERLMSALSHRNFCVPSAPPLRHETPMKSSAYPKDDDGSSFALFMRSRATVRAAHFSSDGQRVVTASLDGTAQVWNSRTGLPVGERLQHQAEVIWAQFSADGRRVVTASLDTTARVWDAETGRAKSPPLRHEGGVLFAEFSSDNRKVLTASQDKTARLWDAETGRPHSPPIRHGGVVYFAKFSPDGSRLLTYAEGLAQVWSEGGTKLAAFPHRVFYDLTLPFPQFSPDNRQVVTAGGHGAQVWDLATKKAAVAAMNHDTTASGMAAVEFSPRGNLVMSASRDNTVRVWDAANGMLAAPAMRHENWVLSAHFDASGERLVSTSRDNSARIWNAHTGRPVTEPLRQDSPIRFAHFSPNGQRLITCSDGSAIWLWDVHSAPHGTAPLPHKGDLRCAVFSPDGRRVASVSRAGTARVWDACTGQLLTDELNLGGGLDEIQFSPDGQRLATAANRMQIFELATGVTVAGTLRHGDSVNCVRFSPDGRRVVTASRDRTARVWDAGTGQPISEFKHAGSVNCAQFSPDGQWVATASYDGTARVWDAHTGRALTEPLPHDDRVHWVEFSPDGQRVATASKDKTVRLWDARTGAMLTKPLTHSDELYQYHTVQFSPDGTRVAAAAGSVGQVWDVRTGEPLTAALKHEGRVNSVRFSLDGQRVVTASYDATARIWDVATGHLVHEPLRHDGRVQYAEFSPDGRFVVTASSDETVRVWELAQAPPPIPDWLPELAEAVAGQRIDSRDISTIVSVENLYQLKQRLTDPTVAAGRSHAASVEDVRMTKYYTTWARWFFADGTARALAPLSPFTLSQMEASTNALELAHVAESLARASNNIVPWMALAESLSRRATELAPGDPEISEVRAAVLEQQGDSAGAIAVLGRILDRFPTSPGLWRTKGAVLLRANQTNDALQAFSQSIAMADVNPSAFSAILTSARLARCETLKALNRLDEAASDSLAIHGIPPRRPQPGPDWIDLSLFYNYELTSILGIAKDSPTALTLEEDVRRKTGVRFDLRGVVALGGKSGESHFPSAKNQPPLGASRGIAVKRRFTRLHFLHGTSKEVPNGTVIGYYLLIYADGRTAEMPVVYGQDLRDCWGAKNEKEPRDAEPAWTTVNHNYSLKGPVRLYKMTRENPHPAVEVVSLDFVSAKTKCAPFLVAITAE